MADRQPLVLFDAVGTLLRPRPCVPEVYHAAGQVAGSGYTQAQIKQRFGAAVQKYFAYGGDLSSGRQALSPDSNSDGAAAENSEETGRTSEQVEYERWQRIVGDVFDDLPDAVSGDSLFQHLWEHFARPASWELFEGTADVWRELRRRGIEVGIASNFDQRLEGICRGLPPLDSSEKIFHSAALGFSKPHPRFYEEIVRRVAVPSQQFVLIGDDWEKDVQGALAAGWNAIHINRAAQHGPIERGVPVVKHLKEVVDAVDGLRT